MRHFIIGSYLLLFAAITFAQAPPPVEVAYADSWITYIWDRVQNVPGFAAIFGSLLISWVVTHNTKINIPINTETRARDWMIRRRAALFAAVPCALIWPMHFDWARTDAKYFYIVSVSGFLVSGLVGAASPLLYSIVMHYLSRFEWAQKLSYSVRKLEITQPAPQVQKDRTDTQ